MENRTTSPSGDHWNNLLAANALVWVALTIAVSIVLWETAFLLQAVPVVALAAIASTIIQMWGMRGLQAKPRD